MPYTVMSAFAIEPFVLKSTLAALPPPPAWECYSDRVPDKPVITLPYKHAALAARMAQAARLEANRQREFQAAQWLRKPRPE